MLSAVKKFGKRDKVEDDARKEKLDAENKKMMMHQPGGCVHIPK